MAIHNAKIGQIVMGTKSDCLVATALGSCVAVVIYDKKRYIGALAHVALPSIQPNWYRQKVNKNTDNLGRYADTAIPEVIRILTSKGTQNHSLVAKITGGSRMFGTDGLLGSGLNIGERNIEAVKDTLKLNKIKLGSLEVGGTTSRTVSFDLENFIFTIKKSLINSIMYI